MRHYKIEVVNNTVTTRVAIASLESSKAIEADFPNEFKQKFGALKLDLQGGFGEIEQEVTYKENGVTIYTWYARVDKPKPSLNIIEVK